MGKKPEEMKCQNVRNIGKVCILKSGDVKYFLKGKPEDREVGMREFVHTLCESGCKEDEIADAIAGAKRQKTALFV